MSFFLKSLFILILPILALPDRALATDITHVPSYIEILASCHQALLLKPRSVWEKRFNVIQQGKIEFKFVEAYAEKNADEIFPPVFLDLENGRRSKPKNADVGIFGFREMFNHRILSRDEEYALFHRMNFVKFRAAERQKQLPSEFSKPMKKSVRSAILAIERDLSEAASIRDTVWSLNLRLTDGVSKAYMWRLNPNDPDLGYQEGLQIAALRLSHLVEKFEIQRGFKFSTLAVDSLRKTLYREVQYREKKGRERQVLPDIDLDYLTAFEDQGLKYSFVERLKKDVLDLVDDSDLLDNREKLIIFYRFGLCGFDAHTLEQTGNALGVTKERIRQIEGRALVKLRPDAYARDLDEFIEGE